MANLDRTPEWVIEQVAAVSGLHPAFDPAVWDLGAAEQTIDQTLDLAARVDVLAQEVANLQRQVADQTVLLTRLLQAWTEE